MTGTKNHKLLILTASFFVLIFVLNYEIYKFYTDSIKSQNSILLNSYKTSIERYVGSDLKIIDAVNTEREQIFILQSLKNNNAKKSLVNISSIGASKFLYYDKNDHSIFIDIKKLQESVEEILPSFINHHLFFNNVSINNQAFQGGEIENYTIGKRLKIALSLDNNSFLTRQNQENIQQTIKHSIGISLIIAVVFIITLICQSRKYKKRITTELSNLNKKKKELEDIHSGRESKSQIDSIFIKKATENYTEQEIQNIEGNNKFKENIVNSIGNKDYVFPLVLKGKKKSKIEVDGFFKNLERNFNNSIFKSRIKIKLTAKYLDIICEKEILYQIVYSIVSNIMMFLEDQSDESKSISINLLEKKIIFSYNGYPMSQDNVIKLSKHINLSYSDIFCLTGKKLFSSIDYHQLTYEINSNGFDNEINLGFSELNNAEISRKESQIIKFNRKSK